MGSHHVTLGNQPHVPAPGIDHHDPSDALVLYQHHHLVHGRGFKDRNHRTGHHIAGPFRRRLTRQHSIQHRNDVTLAYDPNRAALLAHNHARERLGGHACHQLAEGMRRGNTLQFLGHDALDGNDVQGISCARRQRRTSVASPSAS